MSDARGRRAREKFRGRFAGAREDEGRARQHRAKINLQAAVASNVVKGAPYRWRTGRRLGRQRAAEALEGVKDELRRSVVPEVNRIHSVRSLQRRSAAPGSGCEEITYGDSEAPIPAAGGESRMMHSASAVAATPASCSG